MPTMAITLVACSACYPQCIHPPCPLHAAFHGNVFNPDTSKLVEYAELSKSSDGHLWQQADSTEIHCLVQGAPTIPGTNTMFFIPVTSPPPHQCATYLCIVFAHCPEKVIPHCVHWTVSGDCIKYLGNVSTKMANIITTKLLFNSIMSTPNA